MIPVYIMLGGGLGALGRYYLSQWCLAMLGNHLPYGTLAVNMVGSLLIGVAIGILQQMPSEPIRLFFVVGVLGGFTTFSTFSLEVMMLMQKGQWAVAGGYVVASILCALLATYLSFFLTSRWL